jgi:hypothetical protein
MFRKHLYVHNTSFGVFWYIYFASKPACSFSLASREECRKVKEVVLRSVLTVVFVKIVNEN